jgi:DNA-binding transcriptional LysR family regulator
MATFASAASSIVPLAIAAFRVRHPAVELSVEMADPPDSIPSLQAGELDLALSHDAIGRPAAIELIHLFDDPMYVAMRAGHPLADSPLLSLADFAMEPWMLATTHTCPDSRLFLRACHDAGFEPQIAFQNDDYPAILGFVAAGVGVAMIPDMVARGVRDDVVVRDLDPPAPPRPILAAVPEGYRSPAVDAMLAVLRELSGEWVESRPPLSFASKSDQFART